MKLRKYIDVCSNKAMPHIGETEFSRYAAGAIFIAVPIVTLCFALSYFLVAGVYDGAVKG